MIDSSNRFLVYRFRVELRHVRPAVWREFVVPGAYSFWDLHVAIQDAMGWLDYHLHAFRPVDGIAPSGDWEIGIPDEDFPEAEPRTLAGWKEPVAGYFQKPGDRMEYIYDFGDNWAHDLLLMDVVASDSLRPVACTDGARACPPEDCGGPGGYQELLEVLSDPAHDRYQELVEWVGDSFDPEHFEPAEVVFDDPQARWTLAFGAR